MSSTLASRLKLAMLGPPKVSQVALAKACGIAPPSVANWLSGKSKSMEGSNLLAASRKLNVNPDWLADNRGPMRTAAHTVEEPIAPYHDDQSPHVRAAMLLRQLDPKETAEAISFMEWQISKRHNPDNGNRIPVAA